MNIIINNTRGTKITKTNVKTTTYGSNSVKYKLADDQKKLHKNHLVNTNITVETFCWKKYVECLKTSMYNAYV